MQSSTTHKEGNEVDIGADELEFLRSVFDSARAGNTPLMGQFLARGGTVNLTNNRGDTLLILAAYHCQLQMVQLLLDHDADLDRSNDNGQTALAAAVFRRRSDIVDLLLHAGADPDDGRRSARAIAEFFGLTDMASLLPTNINPDGPQTARR